MFPLNVVGDEVNIAMAFLILVMEHDLLVRIKLSINIIITFKNIALDKRELEEILTKGRAPSPVLEMPLQYSLHHQPHSTETYIPNENNLSKTNGSSQQPIYDNHPQYPVYSSTQPQPSNTNFDFQRFYEPV
ncbi:unnamed protein product, partial [Adineta steineri]